MLKKKKKKNTGVPGTWCVPENTTRYPVWTLEYRIVINQPQNCLRDCRKAGTVFGLLQSELVARVREVGCLRQQCVECAAGRDDAGCTSSRAMVLRHRFVRHRTGNTYEYVANLTTRKSGLGTAPLGVQPLHPFLRLRRKGPFSSPDDRFRLRLDNSRLLALRVSAMYEVQT